MKAALVFLILCGAVHADVIIATSEQDKPKAIERYRKEKLQRLKGECHAKQVKVDRHTKSLGLFPCKYPEMFGPYVLFAFQDSSRQAANFEARFVDIKSGFVIVGIDDVPTDVTATKQIRQFSFPLKYLPLPQVRVLQKEIAKRQTAAAHKRVLYPEPAAEPDPEVKIVAVPVRGAGRTTTGDVRGPKYDKKPPVVRSQAKP